MTEDIQKSEWENNQTLPWNNNDNEMQAHDIIENQDGQNKEIVSTSQPKKGYPIPEPCKVLGVFGLSQRTTEDQLRNIFSQYGTVDRATLILDRATQISKCFGFVYMNSVEEATKAKNAVNDMTLDGRKVRVDYSITKEPHVPTPGQYLGRKLNPRRRYDSHRRDRVYSRYGSRRYDEYSPRRDRYQSPSYSRSPPRGRRYSRRDYDDRSRSPSYSYSRSRSPGYRKRSYRRHYDESSRRYSRSPSRD